jgi:hypothetical protein
LLTSPPAVAKHARLAFVVCDLLCVAYSAPPPQKLASLPVLLTMRKME